MKNTENLESWPLKRTGSLSGTMVFMTLLVVALALLFSLAAQPLASGEEVSNVTGEEKEDGANTTISWPVLELVVTATILIGGYFLVNYGYKSLRRSSNPRARKIFIALNRIVEESKAEPLPDVPVQDKDHQSSVPGIYLAGEMAGTVLLRPGMRDGIEVTRTIALRLENGRSRAGEHQEFGDKQEGTKGSKEDLLDLIIVGAGPAGLAAGLEAKKLGLDYLILEKDSWAWKIRQYPRGKQVTGDPRILEIDSPLEFEDMERDRFLKHWGQVLASSNIQLKEDQELRSLEGDLDSGFTLVSSEGRYRARYVLLAMGVLGPENRLEVQGEDLPQVHRFLADPGAVREKKVVVVGGGDSAIETAVALAENNDVTLSYRRPFFSRLTSSNQARIDELEEKGSVDVVYDSVVKVIRSEELDLEVAGCETRTVEADEVYLQLGRRPNRKFLSSLGLEFESDWSLTETLKQSMKRPVTRNDIIGCILLIILGLGFYYLLKYSSFTGNDPLYLWGYKLAFWYYTFYTLGVVSFGLWFMYRFKDARNSRLMNLRMMVIIIIQLTVGFIFSNPDNNPFMQQWTGNDFFDWQTYQLIIVWPLELQPLVWNWLDLERANSEFYLPWVLAFSFIVIPVGAFLFGKGFYCSGLCGCGALGETVGDPFRAKAARNKYAYKLEYSKYIILIWAIILSCVMVKNRIVDETSSSPFYHVSYFIYWMFILWFLSSVIGVTTYPVLSGRSWCRYFCPMAAVLGLFSMISPNMVKTDKERCIGCNKCNENCQYGINIKGKALLGKPVRTRECVQCGVCVAVCPTHALEVQFALGRKKKGKDKQEPKESSYRPYRNFGKLR